MTSQTQLTSSVVGYDWHIAHESWSILQSLIIFMENNKNYEHKAPFMCALCKGKYHLEWSCMTASLVLLAPLLNFTH